MAIVCFLLGKLKEAYQRQYGRHHIHVVDENRRIVLKEVMIDEFAVTLKLLPTTALESTFAGEARRYRQDLNSMERCEDIQCCDLIDSHSRVTFVRGIAGMGKSVLCSQLVYGWAKDEIYRNFKICVMFECREINAFADNKGGNFERRKSLNQFLNEKFNCDFEDGENLLFIVDGVDELYDIHENDSVIWELLDIENSKYSKSKIILTGRPHVQNKFFRSDRKTGG